MRDSARFQRGRSSCVPARVRPWKSKFSSTKSAESREARAQPLLEGGQVGALPQGGGAAQVVGLVDVDDEAADGHVGSARPRVPVEAGGEGIELAPQGRVVGQEGIAVGDRVAVVRGQGRLQRHDAPRPAVGVGHARQRQEAPGVGDVGLADRLVVVLAVVGLVGQSDAGLDQGDHVGGGVVRVGAHVGAHQASDALSHERAHGLGQLRSRAARLDDVQFGAQGGGAGLVDGVLVEELRPQGRDALGVHIVEDARRRVLGNCAGIFFGCVAQCVEGAVHRAVGRDFVGRQPGPVHVAVKIVLWAHGAVHVRGFEDLCEQCVRHALTVGGFVPIVRDLEILVTRPPIYVTITGCNYRFSRSFRG